MDTSNVIATAAQDHVKGIADDLDVSLSRMYELLSRDNPYPKLWRILKSLARRNPDGLRLVQADFDARCHAALCDRHEHVTCAQLHKELGDVIQAHLEQRAATEQRREIREAIAVLEKCLDELSEGVRDGISN